MKKRKATASRQSSAAQEGDKEYHSLAETFEKHDDRRPVFCWRTFLEEMVCQCRSVSWPIAVPWIVFICGVSGAETGFFPGNPSTMRSFISKGASLRWMVVSNVPELLEDTDLGR